MRALRLVSLTVLCAHLAACTVGPDYHSPQISMPAGFVVSSTAAAHTSAAPLNDTVEIPEWWRSLKDPQLDSLVDQAIKENLDLEIALTRLQQARTQGAVALGRALPDIEASGAAGRGTGSDVTRGLVAPALHAADNATGSKQIRQVVGFDAGWEIDLFGKYRREIEASEYDVQAAAAARNAVLISVVADVVRTYFDLRAFQMRMAVTRQNIATAQQSLDLVQARYDHGLTNELDVTLAKRELATQAAQVAPLDSEIDAARYTIAVLLGRYPEDLGRELESPGMIPELPEKVGAGLPVELLRRRPDIREAERQLAAATARVGVATANLFPHLALTAAVGFQAGRGVGMSPMTSNPIWSAGPTAYWSLLDFGTLDALVNVADLQAQALLIGYRQTVIDAVREVDTAISVYAAQQDRLRRLSDAVVASQRAVTLATERYNRGLTDFLNVSDAERAEYDLEGQYVVAKQAAAVALVALYKALGGGWEHYGSVPPIRQPQPAIIAAFRRLLFDSGNAEQ